MAARFLGYGWKVTHVSDANDPDKVVRDYETFLNTHDRPTLVIVESPIGYGAPHEQDTSAAHGEPLAPKRSGWQRNSTTGTLTLSFMCLTTFRRISQGAARPPRCLVHAAWDDLFAAYRSQYPDLADQIDHMQRGELPGGWDSALPIFPSDAKGLSIGEEGA